MKVKLVLNIGTTDAKRLELKKFHEDDIVDVPQNVADELLQRKWAVAEDGKHASTSAAVQPEPELPGTAPTPTESPRPAKANKPQVDARDARA